jgi:hypothetical protein
LIKIRQNFQLQALDYLLPPKSSITGTNTSEQEVQQGTSQSPVRDISLDEAAAIELEQIKLFLTPHHPP